MCSPNRSISRQGENNIERYIVSGKPNNSVCAMSIMSARIDSCSSAFSTGFVQKFESPRTSYSHSASPSVSHDMCAAVTSDIEVWSSGERGSAEFVELAHVRTSSDRMAHTRRWHPSSRASRRLVYARTKQLLSCALGGRGKERPNTAGRCGRVRWEQRFVSPRRVACEIYEFAPLARDLTLESSEIRWRCVKYARAVRSIIHLQCAEYARAVPHITTEHMVACLRQAVEEDASQRDAETVFSSMLQQQGLCATDARHWLYPRA